MLGERKAVLSQRNIAGEAAVHFVVTLWIVRGWGLLISATLTIFHPFSVLDIVTKTMWFLN